jgi:predicted nuclease of predicted toxin-antitoxin system
VKWLADECFDNDIVRGLLRRSPDFDLVRAQDVSEVAGRDDERLFAWAGKNGRVVLTHDLATMVPAIQLQGQPELCAIVLVPDSLPIGRIIEGVLLLDQCSREADWTAGVSYLPLRWATNVVFVATSGV